MNISDAIKKTGISVDKPALDKTASNKTTAADQEKPTSSIASDSVTLSATGVALQADIRNSEVFDAKKVEAIKSAIARGEFNVDSSKVADGLMQTVQDLIKSQ